MVYSICVWASNPDLPGRITLPRTRTALAVFRAGPILARRMTAPERASQIWPVLLLAAKNRQILNYELLSDLIGVPRAGLGQLLEPIQSYCLLNGLPALTVLVVSNKTGLPGPGFVAAKDIPATLMKVFKKDAKEWPKPTPKELADAVRKRPSNGQIGPDE